MSDVKSIGQQRVYAAQTQTETPGSSGEIVKQKKPEAPALSSEQQQKVKNSRNAEGMMAEAAILAKTGSATKAGGAQDSYSWGPSYDQVKNGTSAFRTGQQGSGVKQTQQLLKEAGYPINANGKFDKFTEATVRKFQKENNVEPVNGIVDKKTLEAMEKKAPAAAASKKEGVGGPKETAPVSPTEIDPIVQMKQNYEKAAEMLESGRYQKGQNPKFDKIIEDLINQPDPIITQGKSEYAEMTEARMRFLEAARKAGYNTGRQSE